MHVSNVMFSSTLKARAVSNMYLYETNLYFNAKYMINFNEYKNAKSGSKCANFIVSRLIFLIF